MFVTGNIFGHFTFLVLVFYFCILCSLNFRHILKMSIVIDDQNHVLSVRNYLRYREVAYDSIEGYRVIGSMMGNRTGGPAQKTAGLPIIFYRPNHRIDVSAALITQDNLNSAQALLDLMKRLDVALI